MKSLRLVLIAVVLAAILGGCSSGDSGGSDEQSGSSGQQSEAPAGSSVAAIEIETDGEAAALEAAESQEGRRWASGDWENGTPVEGEAFLAGYTVVVHNGTNQWEVKVLDGEVVPFFGIDGETFISSAYMADYSTVYEPESDQQLAAFDAAVESLEATQSDATQGGIESYVFYFPPNPDGTYPSVTVYAQTTLGTFATGGAERR